MSRETNLAGKFKNMRKDRDSKTLLFKGVKVKCLDNCDL